jgi:hypothetical protein
MSSTADLLFTQCFDYAVLMSVVALLGSISMVANDFLEFEEPVNKRQRCRAIKNHFSNEI